MGATSALDAHLRLHAAAATRRAVWIAWAVAGVALAVAVVLLARAEPVIGAPDLRKAIFATSFALGVSREGLLDVANGHSKVFEADVIALAATVVFRVFFWIAVISFAQVQVTAQSSLASWLWGPGASIRIMNGAKTVRSLNSMQERLLALPTPQKSKKSVPEESMDTPQRQQRESPVINYSSPGESLLYGGERGYASRRRKRSTQFKSPVGSKTFGTPGSTLSGSSGTPRAPLSTASGNGRFASHRQLSNTPTSNTVCPNCSTPILVSNSTLVSQPANDADEAAFSLLQNLTVDWDESGVSARPKSIAYFIDEWVDNLVKVLSRYVHENVINALEKNTELLQELPGGFFPAAMLHQGLESHSEGSFSMLPSTGFNSMSGIEVAKQRATQAYNEVLNHRDTSSGGLFSSSQPNSQLQQHKFEAQQALSTMTRLLDERARLERSLTFTGPLANASGQVSKETVLKKLRSLFSSQDRLSNYTWDSTAPPFDPDVLVHIACDWLDRTLRIDERQLNFSSYHLRDVNSRESPEEGMFAKQKWWGLQRSMIPSPDGRPMTVPQYDLNVQGKFWNVRSGRHNALHALVLLIYSMKAARVVGIEPIEHIVGGQSFFN